jgi:hypothetical protein
MDGLTGSIEQQDEMFGAERLNNTFCSFDGSRMLISDSLFVEIDQFQAVQSSHEDCTALVMNFHKRFVGKEQL